MTPEEKLDGLLKALGAFDGVVSLEIANIADDMHDANYPSTAAALARLAAAYAKVTAPEPEPEMMVCDHAGAKGCYAYCPHRPKHRPMGGCSKLVCGHIRAPVRCIPAPEPVTCSECGRELIPSRHMRKTWDGPKVICGDCTARRDLAAKLKARGERVKATLQVGDWVLVNEDVYNFDFSLGKDYILREERGKVFQVGSLHSDGVYLAGASASAFYFNVTPLVPRDLDKED